MQLPYHAMVVDVRHGRESPVRDKILRLASLRPNNDGVVNLVKDAFGEREPLLTQIRTSSPHSVLVAECPARFDVTNVARGLVFNRIAMDARELKPVAGVVVGQ